MADNKSRAAAPKSQQPSWLPSNVASASKLNVVSDTVQALLSANAAPDQVNVKEQEKINTVMMQVADVFSDCITCKTILREGQIDNDGAVTVAKPPLLRKSLYNEKTRDGITFAWNDIVVDGGERTATDEDDAEEIQVIVPSYQPGDLIMVAFGGEPWLTTEVGGVETEDENEDAENGEPKQGGIIVTAFDMNLDARAWARKNQQTLETE